MRTHEYSSMGTAGSLPDNNTLVLFVSLHVIVRIVSDGENVWRQFTDLLFFVQLNLFSSVDRQNLVRIDCHKNRTSVRLEINNTINIIVVFHASKGWTAASQQHKVDSGTFIDIIINRLFNDTP